MAPNCASEGGGGRWRLRVQVNCTNRLVPSLRPGNAEGHKGTVAATEENASEAALLLTRLGVLAMGIRSDQQILENACS